MGKTTDHFDSWMNDSITYKEKLSDDGMSVVYASDGVEIPCYVVGQTLLITNNKGQEVTSMEHIFMNGSNVNVVAINHDGIIVINGRNRPIQKIEPFKDEDGVLDLVVIYL